MANFEYKLQNFPDWAVPMTRIVPVFTTTNPSVLNNPLNTLTYQFNYLFRRDSENNYTLKVFVAGSLLDSGSHRLPLWVDINMYLLNENIFNTSQEGIS